MTDSLQLGPLTLCGTLRGPLVEVSFLTKSLPLEPQEFVMSVCEWTSLVALSDVLAQADKEMARLREQIDFMRNRWTMFGGRPCALCVYENSKYVRPCKLHEYLSAVSTHADDMEIERDDARSQLAAAQEEIKRLRAGHDNPAGRIADLEFDRAELRQQLAAMTAARDEACEIAEAATFVIDNGLCERCRSSIENVHVERIDQLRKVGQ